MIERRYNISAEDYKIIKEQNIELTAFGKDFTKIFYYEGDKLLGGIMVKYMEEFDIVLLLTYNPMKKFNKLMSVDLINVIQQAIDQEFNVVTELKRNTTKLKNILKKRFNYIKELEHNVVIIKHKE